MPIPNPTLILRIIHKDNLHIYLRRGGIHAPNNWPSDGLTYKTIHNLQIQSQRGVTQIPCGSRGCIHDYVSFYFGYLSPMMLNLKTGRVAGYEEGQEPLIYLVSTAQKIQQSGIPIVFSDGHGNVVRLTQWFNDLQDLDKVDWDVVYRRYWKDDVNDMDRQRRKQAEFLVYRFCDWSLIKEIAVIDSEVKSDIENTMWQFPKACWRPIQIRSDWYYY